MNEAAVARSDGDEQKQLNYNIFFHLGSVQHALYCCADLAVLKPVAKSISAK